MSILFVNACFRDDSRTLYLADAYLKKLDADIEQVNLGDMDLHALDRNSLLLYNASVASHTFEDPMFDYAKQFRDADEIVIAAPFWNYSIPAILHTYIELVCTQGITFDVAADGRYYSLCKAKKLVFITTSGGFIPEKNHSFDYIKSLADSFWEIKDVDYYHAEGLDIYGVDVREKLQDAMSLFKV